VVRLTETLAEEVMSYNIQVNAIAPGAVNTRMLDEVLAVGEVAGEEWQAAQKRQLQGGTPVELAAKLALFLASDASDGLTGKLISAPHDAWQEWDPAQMQKLAGTPWYTLRRIDPHTLRPFMEEHQ
jgi:NAD(P)-dependent dehydrogenase (short-subunit alcohol dehydrogenase family)